MSRFAPFLERRNIRWESETHELPTKPLPPTKQTREALYLLLQRSIGVEACAIPPALGAAHSSAPRDDGRMDDAVRTVYECQSAPAAAQCLKPNAARELAWLPAQSMRMDFLHSRW